MGDGPEQRPESNTERIRKRLVGDREERLEREVAELRATVDQMRDDFGRLAGKMNAAAGGGDDEKPPFHLSLYDPEALEVRTAELAAWVSDVLTSWHPTAARVVKGKGCWVSHKDALQAVHAAELAFRACHTAKGRKDTDPATWQRDWVPALQKQLEAAVGKAMEACPRCGPGLGAVG